MRPRGTGVASPGPAFEHPAARPSMTNRMHHTTRSLLLLAGLALGAAGAGQAQQPGSGGAMPSTAASGAMPGAMGGAAAGSSATGAMRGAGGGRVAKADADFVRDAARGGMAEVALGRLAEQQGADDRVKEYGRRMVADHGQKNDELARIATGKGMTPPAEPTAQQRADAQRLGRLNGEAFDRAYARQMVVDHRKTVALFEKQARSGRDPELKDFAERTLPALREHLQMAQQLPSTPSRGAARNATQTDRAPTEAMPR